MASSHLHESRRTTTVALLREEEDVSGRGRRWLPGEAVEEENGGSYLGQLDVEWRPAGRRRHGALPRVEEDNRSRRAPDERGGGGIAEGIEPR